MATPVQSLMTEAFPEAFLPRPLTSSSTRDWRHLPAGDRSAHFMVRSVVVAGRRAHRRLDMRGFPYKIFVLPVLITVSRCSPACLVLNAANPITVSVMSGRSVLAHRLWSMRVGPFQAYRSRSASSTAWPNFSSARCGSSSSHAVMAACTAESSSSGRRC
jgi:hypothetical protein